MKTGDFFKSSLSLINKFSQISEQLQDETFCAVVTYCDNLLVIHRCAKMRCLQKSPVELTGCV